ncbi:MAG: hypothetical protein GX600_11780 [Dehalococcoidia bacterium]|nr:hypothetical protein [Dehalococcoidia bacterium]
MIADTAAEAAEFCVLSSAFCVLRRDTGFPFASGECAAEAAEFCVLRSPALRRTRRSRGVRECVRAYCVLGSAF